MKEEKRSNNKEIIKHMSHRSFVKSGREKFMQAHKHSRCT